MTDAEILLSAGRARARLRPDLGGRLAALEMNGRHLLRREEDGTSLGWAYWGAYPLLPWSNRIPSGRFDHAGTTVSVEPNWDDGTAIHGLTAWTPWQVTSTSAGTVRLETTVDHAPWHLACWSVFDLTAERLRWELGARNIADHAAPVGLGIHPWFPAGELQVPADAIWPAEACLPTGPRRPVTSDTDLRSGGTPPTIDACYTDLTADHLTVSGIRMSWEGPITQVVACTVDSDWYAIEPVTNATDGFNLAARGVDGHGVIELEPDDEIVVAYEISETSTGT